MRGKQVLLLILVLLGLTMGCKAQKSQLEPEVAMAELQQRGIDYSPQTFLDYASNGDTAIVKLFLDAGMNPDVTSDEGETALMLAAALDNVSTAQLLLSRGANVSAKDDTGNTALAKAALMGNSRPLRILIEAGTDVNGADSHGWTPLIYATFMSHYECVRLLLEKGADINAQSDEGSTALIVFVKSIDSKEKMESKLTDELLYKRDPRKTLDILLEYNADANIRNKRGQTALTIAEGNGVPEIATRLRELAKNDHS